MDYLPVFMAHGFFRTRTEFMEDHVIFDRFAKYPKVKRYIGEAKLQRLRRSILVEMPVERHTTRERETVFCDYDRDLYKWVVKNRMDPWTEEPLRDAGGVCRILRKVVSDNDWRSEQAKRGLSYSTITTMNSIESLRLQRALDCLRRNGMDIGTMLYQQNLDGSISVSTPRQQRDGTVLVPIRFSSGPSTIPGE